MRRLTHQLTTTRPSKGDITMLALFVRLQTLFVTGYDRVTSEDDGATAVEYGLLVGLIAVAIVATLLLLGPKLAAIFQTATDSIPAA
jgi:pilus assembly protein Flp/PilA